MPNRFLNNITINDEYTLPSSDGSANQVIATDGSGNLSFVDQSGGASLSGGEASKVAVWSATDTLTHNDNFHFDTANVKLGIGTASPSQRLSVRHDGTGTYPITLENNQIGTAGAHTGIRFGYINNTYQKGAIIFEGQDSSGRGKMFFAMEGTADSSNADETDAKLTIDYSGNVGIGETAPNRPLVVSETRTGSTASDAYTAIVKSVQSSGASPNPGTGGLKVQYTSSSSNVHAFGLVAGSSSSDFLTTGPMHFYTNSDLDTVSATGFAMQLDTSQRLILGSMTASQKLNVSGNVTADRYYGNSSTVYYLDPNDGTQSANLASKIRVGTGSLVLSLTPNWGVPAQNIFASTDTTNGGTITLMNVNSTDAAGDGSGTLQFVIGAGNTGSSGGTGYATAAITAISRSNPGSGTSGGGNLIFKTSGGYSTVLEKMRLTESGKLGIGVDPTEKLHVDDGFLKVQPPDISSTTPPSITIRSLTNEYQSGMESSGHLTMKSAGSSSNFYWYQGSTNVMRYSNALYVNKILDINSDAYYLDPASSGVSLHINGIIDQDFSVTDLNSAWTAPGTSRDQGFIFGRFQASASNAPGTNDNANWFANIYSHASGGTASYGIQLAGSNAGSGENALQLRNVSNGSFASWRKVYHEGHKPTYSELGTMDYSNLTNTPTIPSAYSHPTHPGDDISIDTGALTGATVISDLDFNITTDTLGHVTDANAAISTRTLTASDITTGTFNDLFAVATRYNIGLIDGSSSQTRDKIRVWNSSSYTIGMKSGFTYGHLNDYAMSFQMNDDNDRGFWWGDTTHTDAQGAMSLTTNGRLTVAESISIGQGASVTSPSTFPLYVDGTAVFDTTGNTEPICITRSGSTSAEVLKIGVSDRVAQFNYIEDTSNEGTSNFGQYDFILGGNSSESSTTALVITQNGVQAQNFYDYDNTGFYFQPESTSGTSWRLQTPTGYLQIGSRNSSYVHFYTDRGQYYFDKGLTVDTGAIRSYNEDLNLNRAGSSTARVVITDGLTRTDQNMRITGTSGNDAVLTLKDGNTSGYIGSEIQFSNTSDTIGARIEYLSNPGASEMRIYTEGSSTNSVRFKTEDTYFPNRVHADQFVGQTYIITGSQDHTFQNSSAYWYYNWHQSTSFSSVRYAENSFVAPFDGYLGRIYHRGVGLDSSSATTMNFRFYVNGSNTNISSYYVTKSGSGSNIIFEFTNTVSTSYDFNEGDRIEIGWNINALFGESCYAVELVRKTT